MKETFVVKKFKKIVAVDNISFTEDRYQELDQFAEQVDIYRDYPTENEEIVRRIGDADCVLVSWNTRIDRAVIESCSGIRYIGMCCSLYDEKSANVDIMAAREHDIVVLGVRDYGDQGVVAYVTSQLSSLLHGFNGVQWKPDQILEVTGRKIGIIGLGTTGTMVGQALQMFGGDIYYYDVKRKAELERKGFKYLPLDELLATVEIVTTHLPKHLRLLDKEKLAILGDGKIVINPSIGPTYNIDDMEEWLERDAGNFLLSEKSSMAAHLDRYQKHPNFLYVDRTVGMTEEAKQRLIQKVLDNITSFLKTAK